MTRAQDIADQIADRAIFLATTFEDRSCGINGHSNYRLADRDGRMVIRYGTEGFVTVSVDGHPALYRSPVFGYTQIYNGMESLLCVLLGIPQEVAI